LTFTTRWTPETSLLSALPEPTGAFSRVNGGDGLVGWCEAARFTVSGADRFEEAHRWWTSLAGSAMVDNKVGIRGTGPVAFASLTFDERSDQSVIVVPNGSVGRRDGVSWVTTVGDSLPPRQIAGRPGAVRYEPGSIAPSNICVRSAAVERIQRGRLPKVVLARDLVATTQKIDERFVLSRLASASRDSWVFTVDCDGGASPFGLEPTTTASTLPATPCDKVIT
jgi:menaquinone-specific isochorismate synthase